MSSSVNSNNSASKEVPERNVHKRLRVAGRAHLACLNCKTSKSRCDDQVPTCANCLRYGLICLIEDPVSRRHLPRNYVESLEQRVAYLETVLRYSEGTSNVQLSQSTPAELAALSPSTATIPSLHDPRDENDDNQTVEDLASKVGTLSLNAAGAEPRYLGSSSTFAFARLLKPALDQIALRSSLSIIGHGSSSNVIPAACPLPDQETAALLSQAFFENINTQYPFIHEPTFRGWEAAINLPLESCFDLEFDPIPFYFLNMVYAVGALLIPQTDFPADRLYTSAMTYIDPILTRDNLESIQAVLCCAAYSLRSSVGTSHWKLAGLAVRQCVELGYHRGSGQITTELNPLRLEMRKRVLWSAYSMECAACIHLGRPLSLHSHEIDAELPTDIDNLHITIDGIDGTPRIHRCDPATNVTRAIFSIKLRTLQGRIHAELYSDTRRGHVSRTDQRKRIASLHQELDAWNSTLPAQFQSVWRPLSLFMTTDWSIIVYNSALLQLYRTQLTENSSSGADTDVAKICISAAAVVCHAFRRQFFGKPTTFTWGALHELFLAAFTYIYCLWTCSAGRENLTLQEISNTCNDCTIAFVILAERWPGAGPYRDLFEALKSKTLEMLSSTAVRDDDLLQTSVASMGPDLPSDLYSVDVLPDWVATVGGGLRGSLRMDQLLDTIIDSQPS